MLFCSIRIYPPISRISEASFGNIPITLERRFSSRFSRSMWFNVRKKRRIPSGSIITVIVLSKPSSRHPICRRSGLLIIGENLVPLIPGILFPVLLVYNIQEMLTSIKARGVKQVLLFASEGKLAILFSFFAELFTSCFLFYVESVYGRCSTYL